MATTDKKLADDLHPASWRGVPFQVQGSDISAGRRTQVHEYPQRDKPWVEDIGRATRELAFEGFLVGADYVDQATTLLAALEEPGPGTLVHPWFGSLKVCLKESARVSFDAGLGQARVSMAFVEAGDLEFPMAASSTQAASRQAASGLETAALDTFASRFSVAGFQDFVAAAANGQLGDMLNLMGSSSVGKVLGYADSLASTVSAAIALVSAPTDLGLKILGALGLSGLTTTVAAWTNIVRALSRLTSDGSLSGPTPSSVYTPSRLQANANAAAVYGLGRQLLLAQAVGASSLVGTAADAQAGRLAYGDLIAVRNELASALDQESLTASDTVYQALLDARGAVWGDITARARDSARLMRLTPPETTPALVLAYDLYEDATRDAEVVGLNRVRHPGFVPATPLQVLSR